MPAPEYTATEGELHARALTEIYVRHCLSPLDPPAVRERLRRAFRLGAGIGMSIGLADSLPGHLEDVERVLREASRKQLSKG